MTMDTMAAKNKVENDKINEQTRKINTAFYAIGTEKELKAHKILTKERWLYRIGKNKELQGNFDKSYFTKIDITKLVK